MVEVFKIKTLNERGLDKAGGKVDTPILPVLPGDSSFTEDAHNKLWSNVSKQATRVAQNDTLH